MFQREMLLITVGSGKSGAYINVSYPGSKSNSINNWLCDSGRIINHSVLLIRSNCCHRPHPYPTPAPSQVGDEN